MRAMQIDAQRPSMAILTVHPRVKRSALHDFLRSSVYVRLMTEMVAAGHLSHGEIWLLGDATDELTFGNLKVHLHTDCRDAIGKRIDILFVRGDHKCYLPLFKSSPAKRLLFYAASGRGIPRYWNQWHGILIDDIQQVPIVRRYYPGAYIGEFMKTAVPEVFHPLPNEKKQYDVCLVGDLLTARKNLGCIKEAIAVLPQVNFVICGKRADRDAIEQFSARPGQVACLGFIGQDELNQVYNRSRLGVLTSNKSDASPRVILEFMAAGLPVLANEQLCGIRKFLPPDAGRIAPADDFARVIPEMLATAEQYHPHQVFEERFCPPKMAADFARHVDAVWKMPPAAPRPSWRGRLARLTRARVDKYDL